MFDHRWKITIGKCVDLRLLTTETRFDKNFSNSNVTETNYNSQHTSLESCHCLLMIRIHVPDRITELSRFSCALDNR